MRFFLALLLLSTAAWALEFESITHLDKRYTLCRVDLRKDQLHLFLKDEDGQYLKSFSGIEHLLAPRGQRLAFAMNAGMYHPGLIPVGWFVEGGKQVAPITLADADGNFFLKPNGVFLIKTDGTAQILESTEAAALKEPVQLATQSGPMLVLNNKLHPAFRADSPSTLFRNGVGLASAHDVIFAISEDAVNLHSFATLFRDTLHCPNALFFDGTISSLHAPPLKRSDQKIDLGPMIGVVEFIPKPQP